MLSPVAKARWGMRDTKNLVVRAKLCVECHVGTGGERDVNHDLIAAGHPRLAFEYSSYLAIYPKHWSGRAEKQRYPDFEARTWAIGQVASAEQALKLLAHRAGTVRDSRPWPEFAEYNCFACHHDLREPSWRIQRRFAKQLRGRLPWGTWYFSDLLSESLDFRRSDKAAREFLAFLGKVRKEMEHALPDRQKVAAAAQSAARHLDRWLNKLGNTPCQAPAALVKLYEGLKSTKEVTFKDWDEATQQYLALAALYNAVGDVKTGSLPTRAKAALEKRANQLAFPKGYDSPLMFKPRKWKNGSE
jgi:hypothetical protein